MKIPRSNRTILALALLPLLLVPLGGAVTFRWPAAVRQHADRAQRVGRLSQRDAEAIAIALCKRLYQQSPESLTTASLSGKKGEPGQWSVECRAGQESVYFLVAGDSGRVLRIARDAGGAHESDLAEVSLREAILLAHNWLKVLGVHDAVFDRHHADDSLDLFFQSAPARSGSRASYRIAVDRTDGRVNHFLRGASPPLRPRDVEERHRALRPEHRAG